NKFYRQHTAIISPANRGLRYGDGLFETMKMLNGNIINVDFHFDRLFNGLSLLQFALPALLDKKFIIKQVTGLCQKNKHSGSARIRLAVIRGNGGIFDPENHAPNLIIESWALDLPPKLNENGLVTDVLPGVRKSCDEYSHLKSNNCQPYVLAALYAKKNRLNDCIVLNSFGHVCDSAIANVFIVKGNQLFTPPLSEGCVAGVMRRWMLEKFSLGYYPIFEKALAIEDLLGADELFFTNAIYHLKWVGNFMDKTYGNSITRKIYNHIIETIYG
ncbi:MAG: aminotransferase class IV, partial [Ginsengibacter sp.]